MFGGHPCNPPKRGVQVGHLPFDDELVIFVALLLSHTSSLVVRGLTLRVRTASAILCVGLPCCAPRGNAKRSRRAFPRRTWEREVRASPAEQVKLVAQVVGWHGLPAYSSAQGTSPVRAGPAIRGKHCVYCAFAVPIEAAGLVFPRARWVNGSQNILRQESADSYNSAAALFQAAARPRLKRDKPRTPNCCAPGVA